MVCRLRGILQFRTGCIINSEFVITDDYYGVCFALIFNKPFVFIESASYEGLNNVKALLCSLNLEERIVHCEDDFKKKEYLFRLPVRYKKVNKLMDAMKTQSLQWLNNVLSRQKEEVDRNGQCEIQDAEYIDREQPQS